MANTSQGAEGEIVTEKREDIATGQAGGEKAEQSGEAAKESELNREAAEEVEELGLGKDAASVEQESELGGNATGMAKGAKLNKDGTGATEEAKLGKDATGAEQGTELLRDTDTDSVAQGAKQPMFAVECEWLRYDTASYAMQQNFVPVVRRLVVHNRSERELKQAVVALEAEPAFAPMWIKRVDAIPAGGSADLGPISLQLAGAYLAGLTERLTGTLTLTVTAEDGALLYREASPLTVLAHDQWAGLSSMPEMIAAFIMPNHPVVTSILLEASRHLEQATGSPSFDAYQSRNPNRVRNQAAAVFKAIQERRPVYCVAPASFEETGQRIRLPEAIIENGMGNCLDLSVLYAACLEAAGLHPLIVFTKGHAFPGVWLSEETFSETVQDDISLLTKRLASGIHEISVAEATLLCAGGTAAYSEAEANAKQQLNKSGDFLCFIDVKRARASSIRPLPLHAPGLPNPEGEAFVERRPGWAGTADAGGYRPVYGERIGGTGAPIGRAGDSANGEAGSPNGVLADMEVRLPPREVDAISLPKQKQWERRLLDLSLRNTLINFRLARSALPLLQAPLSELEDALSEGTEFQLLPRPADWLEGERSVELYAGTEGASPEALLIREEFRQKRLRADIGEKDLTAKAVHLYRSARLSLEENGANTLYLALGLLKWYESPASEMARYAPVVLVPVELVRRTSRSGYVLRMRDEEPQINITLLELLRQDFGILIGGLDPLPRDEKGIDLTGIFTALRHAVMTQPRWDIVESAFLGLFSFSRFVMWNDIRSRSADLARNKVVASLMNGGLQWEPTAAFPDPSRLDELYSPQQLPLPISADSSQIAAVCAALGENSFVLHGPPGTGKSQTITNMIAAALASGKSVLFVAEKMAALSVVQRRLEEIGLGAFCLELHSNKSTKKAVLDQLRQAIESARTAPPEEWARQADRLAASRQELNGYVAALHARRPFGASLYEAVERYGRVAAAPAAIRFEPHVPQAMTEEKLAGWMRLAGELRVAAEAAGEVSDHVWSDIRSSAYTPALRQQAEARLQAYAAGLAAVRRSLEQAAQGLRLPADAGSLSGLELHRLREAAELMLEAPAAFPARLLLAADLQVAGSVLDQAIRHGLARDAERSRILERLTPAALELDADAVLAEWQSAALQWFLPRLLKQNRVAGLVSRLAVPGSKISKAELPQLLGAISRYRAESRALAALEPAARELLGDALWNRGEADWSALGQAGQWGLKLMQALQRLYPDNTGLVQARTELGQQLEAGREAFLERQGTPLRRFVEAWSEQERLEQELVRLLAADFGTEELRPESAGWLAVRERKAAAWLANTGRLREWCTWRQVRQRAVDAGMQPVVEAMEQGLIDSTGLVPAFERAWWIAAIEHILAQEQELADFSGTLFEEKIRLFQEATERFEQLTRQEIAARLASRVPAPGATAASAQSEMGILLRAIRSGGRGMPLRKLFEQIPGLLTRICPCLLMSPMSVAQYLDPKFAPFDLVVFDEASQLPTSEAVGAMARGRNVVVVGDPKQLPPTSFFAAGVGEGEEEDTGTEDLESILEDCLALGMPQEHLLWHYRSRHESLIAFSNYHFYESKLLTFPSPYERKSSVAFHPVDGFYDRGRTKQNRREAEQVVEELVRRLRNPELRGKSVGVVTFNAAQQTLIEDLLDEAYRSDHELELAAQSLPEPIFIKNLENVQGDERDIILFSVGYGPDAEGRVALNFGPLNREGGWRRLNVAVSRARHEMHVFSTLRSSHLDVSRTRAGGVSMLRSFLEYAEKGTAVLQTAAAGHLRREAAGIEAQMAERLRELGWQVDLHVGASGYRLDLAVAHPDKPDTYMLAVLCDGDSYRTGKTARDRELLRSRVLSQLGWRLHRAWSMDWLDQPEREVSRIDSVLRALLEQERQDQECQDQGRQNREAGEASRIAESPQSIQSVQSEESARSMESAQIEEPDQSVQLVRPEQSEQPSQSIRSVQSEEPARSMQSVQLDESAHPAPSVQSGEGHPGQQDTLGQVSPITGTRRASYIPAQLSGAGLKPEEFYSASSDAIIRNQISQVIREEGPVSRQLLGRRVLQAWGLTRSGSRIERRLEECTETMLLSTTTADDGTVFYWPDSVMPGAYHLYRVSAGDQERRNAEDLPPEETANAVYDVLFNQSSLPEEELVKETVRLLGYSRAGAPLERAVRSGLQEAVRRGTARIAEGRVSFRG